MQRKSSHKLNLISRLIIIILAPIICIISSFSLDNSQYYIPSVALITLAILSFYLSFESKKIKTAELVILAIMVCLCVCSRTFFAFVPQIKPLCAFVCITGICLGANACFIVGSLSMFLSNFFFGQGAYTAFQMLGMGLVGFLCGLVFYKKTLSKKKILTSLICGAFCFFVYGILVDLSSVLLFIADMNFSSVLAIFVSGIGFNLLHALATMVIVYFINEPMQKKFTRLRVKYEIFDF